MYSIRFGGSWVLILTFGLPPMITTPPYFQFLCGLHLLWANHWPFAGITFRKIFCWNSINSFKSPQTSKVCLKVKVIFSNSAFCNLPWVLVGFRHQESQWDHAWPLLCPYEPALVQHSPFQPEFKCGIHSLVIRTPCRSQSPQACFRRCCRRALLSSDTPLQWCQPACWTSCPPAPRPVFLL